MVSRKIDRRIAEAKRAHRAAEKSLVAVRDQESAELLTELLRGPVSTRFAALSPGGLKGRPDLVPADRLTLLESIRKPAGKTHAIDVGFASWFEIFRARLRYRVVSVVIGAASLASLTGVAWVAYGRTPMMSVIVSDEREWLTRVTHPDGTSTVDTIRSGPEEYDLMGIEDGMGHLRKWVPRRGYDRFDLPISILRRY